MTTRNLLVVSHVQHYRWEGQLWAFGAYAREIDIWADLFPEVVIASPCVDGPPTGDCLPFTRANIRITPVAIARGGDRLRDKLRVAASLPGVVRALTRQMKSAWAIHVRLPGNLGALGALLAPLYSPRIIAKYAGTWPDFRGEPLSYRAQKALLRSRWFRGPVTVYGAWPGQPAHIVPYFTSILSSDQLALAELATRNRTFHTPARVLFVGRFDRGKNAHVLLDAIAQLNAAGRPVIARIVGDGAERERLHEQAQQLNLIDIVTFTGAIPFSAVLEQYAWADILVLASNNAEGWPKAIAEGMAFGLTCIGSHRGLIPQMLADGRGVIIDPVTPQALAAAILGIIADPQQAAEMSVRAAHWSRQYSLEGLRSAIRALLVQWWKLDENDLNPAGEMEQQHASSPAAD